MASTEGGRKEKTTLDPIADGDYEVPTGMVAVRRDGSDVKILANLKGA